MAALLAAAATAAVVSYPVPASAQAADPADPVAQAAVTLAVNPAQIDRDQQSVTFTGQATELPPGATVAQPLADQQVLIDGPGPGGSGGTTAQTDANGDFTASAKVAPGGYQAVISTTSTLTGTTSPVVQVTAQADAIKLTARLTRKNVKYGQNDGVTGTVEYQPDSPSGPFKPLPATTVTLDGSQPGTRAITAVTSASGAFHASLPKETRTGTWTVRAGGGPFLDQQHKVLTVTVQLPTAFRQVEVSLSALRALSVRACLNVTSPGGARDPVVAAITLRHARTAKGPWRKLATIPAAKGSGYCRTGTSSWHATVPAPAANGYYRVQFAGNSGLQSSVSRAVHRWRYPTRITSFSVSPRRVTVKGAITISGRLWRHTSSWHPYAGQRIGILFRYRGTWFIFQHEPRTNSGGYFSGRFTVYVSAQWIAQFDGTKTTFACVTPRVRVTATTGPELPVPRGGPVLRGARDWHGRRPLRTAPVRSAGRGPVPG